jgi:hypothetical protein
MWPLYIGSNGQIRKSIPFSVKVARPLYLAICWLWDLGSDPGLCCASGHIAHMYASGEWTETAGPLRCLKSTQATHDTPADLYVLSDRPATAFLPARLITACSPK